MIRLITPNDTSVEPQLLLRKLGKNSDGSGGFKNLYTVRLASQTIYSNQILEAGDYCLDAIYF